METRLDEIDDRLFRISTFFPQVGPTGFTMNQFLLAAEQPLLFHCGLRQLFPAVREQVARVLPVESLRWVGFGHVEADECGAMNQWLAVAPRAQVVHGEVGCMVSLNDLADRPPRALAHGEVLDLGDRRVRLLATPHCPHNWEAVMLFEERSRTLFGGDLFTHVGPVPPLGGEDIVTRTLEAEAAFPGGTALAPSTVRTIRALAELTPRTIATMHGASFRGDGGKLLNALADGYAQLVRDEYTRSHP